MESSKKIVLVPYWVEEAVNANNLNLADCLSLAKIKPVLSTNDLVLYSLLQDVAVTFTGLPLNGPNNWLVGCLSHTSDGESTELLAFVNSTLTPLKQLPSYEKELVERLFTADAKTDLYTEAFRLSDIGRDTLAIVIYPGFFVDGCSTALQLSLIEAVLKVLYVYDTHSEVSKTPLFLRYLELLSKKG